MNCKPGDLAVCVSKRDEFFGSLWFVLRRAPMKPFRLPNGQKHAAAGPDEWVIESASGSVYPARTDTGCYLMTRYGVGQDRLLRPIRDNDGEDETLTWKAVPKAREAA